MVSSSSPSERKIQGLNMKRVKHETQTTPSLSLTGTPWRRMAVYAVCVSIATNEMNTKASMCASFKRKQGLGDE